LLNADEVLGFATGDTLQPHVQVHFCVQMGLLFGNG